MIDNGEPMKREVLGWTGKKGMVIIGREIEKGKETGLEMSIGIGILHAVEKTGLGIGIEIEIRSEEGIEIGGVVMKGDQEGIVGIKTDAAIGIGIQIGIGGGIKIAKGIGRGIKVVSEIGDAALAEIGEGS